MKKFIAILLSVAMILPMAIMPVFANEVNTAVKTASEMDSVFAEGNDSLVVFVTGIGQSFSYLFDESYVEEGAFENGTLQDYENYAPLIAQGKHTARWNLFNSFDFSKILKLQELYGVFSKNDKNTDLLLALKPHLNEEKQEKIDKAIKILKLLAVWNILKDSGLLKDFL